MQKSERVWPFSLGGYHRRYNHRCGIKTYKDVLNRKFTETRRLFLTQVIGLVQEAEKTLVDGSEIGCGIASGITGGPTVKNVLVEHFKEEPGCKAGNGNGRT